MTAPAWMALAPRRVGWRIAVGELVAARGTTLLVVAVATVPFVAVVVTLDPTGWSGTSFWWMVGTLLVVPAVVRTAIRTQAIQWDHTTELLHVNGATAHVASGNRLAKSMAIVVASAALALGVGTAVQAWLVRDRADQGVAVWIGERGALVVLAVALLSGWIGAAGPDVADTTGERLVQRFRSGDVAGAWRRLHGYQVIVASYAGIVLLATVAQVVSGSYRQALVSVSFLLALAVVPSAGPIVLRRLPAVVDRLGLGLPARLTAARLSRERAASGPLVTLIAVAVAGGLVLSAMVIGVRVHNDAARAVALAPTFRSTPDGVVLVRTLPSVNVEPDDLDLPAAVTDEIQGLAVRIAAPLTILGDDVVERNRLLGLRSEGDAVVVAATRPEAAGLPHPGAATGRPVGVATPAVLTALGLERFASAVADGTAVLLDPLAAFEPGGAAVAPRTGDRVVARLTDDVELGSTPILLEVPAVVADAGSVPLSLPGLLVPPSAVAGISERFRTGETEGGTILGLRADATPAEQARVDAFLRQDGSTPTGTDGSRRVSTPPIGLVVAVAGPALDGEADAAMRTGYRDPAQNPVQFLRIHDSSALLAAVAALTALMVTLVLVLGASQRRRGDVLLWIQGAPPSLRSRLAAIEGLFVYGSGAVAGTVIASCFFLVVGVSPGAPPEPASGTMALSMPWAAVALLLLVAPVAVWAVPRLLVRPVRPARPVGAR